MNPIQSILVIVDPTAKQRPAVAKGVSGEEALGALDLFICHTQAARNIGCCSADPIANTSVNGPKAGKLE